MAQEFTASDTRLFYVVDAPEVNEEIFETFEEALNEYDEMDRIDLSPRLYVGEVRNSFREDDHWNYDDLIDTFDIIKVIKGGNSNA